MENPSVSIPGLPERVAYNRPYLVIRGKIITNTFPEDISFANAIELDYMGSAEFEFDAPTISRLRMWYYKTNNCYRTHDVSIYKSGDKNKPLRIYHRFTDDELVQYVKDLKDHINGKRRFKEHSDLPDNVKGTYCNNRTNYWWDISNDCYYSFDQDAMIKTPKALDNTIANMQK